MCRRSPPNLVPAQARRISEQSVPHENEAVTVKSRACKGGGVQRPDDSVPACREYAPLSTQQDVCCRQFGTDARPLRMCATESTSRSNHRLAAFVHLSPFNRVPARLLAARYYALWAAAPRACRERSVQKMSAALRQCSRRFGRVRRARHPSFYQPFFFPRVGAIGWTPVREG